MKLSELPSLIKAAALQLQQLSEDRDALLFNKKQMDIEIERRIQALDPKVVKNENQREIARNDYRTEQYKDVLIDIVSIESDLALAKIELQYLRDEFSVAKITAGYVSGLKD